MDSRETRGRQLAQDPRIKQVQGPLWFCPSDKSGGYLVNIEAGRCQCPDHTGQKVRCKHIVAVELVRDGQAPQVALTLPASAKARPMPRGDLTTEEISHIRAAMRFLAKRAGGWEPLAKALRAKSKNLARQMKCRAPTAGLALRLARFAGVPIDDVLAGRYPPPGACPHCGQTPQTLANGPTG